MINLPHKDHQVVAVVGGQFGSEGKGNVVENLINWDHFDVAVRVGAPQAGHTVKGDLPSPFPFRTIPAAAAFDNPNQKLVIGAAAVVDPMLFVREMAGTFAHDRVYIDPRATVLLPEYAKSEEDQGIQGRLGSTSKGVGVARSERVMRRAMTVEQYTSTIDSTWLEGAMLADTVGLLNSWAEQGQRILLEGAQGMGLSLFTGGFYPYATSGECGATQMLADTGLRHDLDMHVIGVYRTYPIRVAGNSGPLRLETTWEYLAANLGDHIKPEVTTVTKKIRRVGHWDPDLARRTSRQIDSAALMFVDYPKPEGPWDEDFLAYYQEDLLAPIAYLGTGPHSTIPAPGYRW